MSVLTFLSLEMGPRCVAVECTRLPDLFRSELPVSACWTCLCLPSPYRSPQSTAFVRALGLQILDLMIAGKYFYPLNHLSISYSQFLETNDIYTYVCTDICMHAYI